MVSIGNYSFFKSSIDEIFIPKNVKVIEKNAFQNCHNLKILTFDVDSKLTNVGSNAFQSSAVISFVFPPKIKKIKNNALSTLFFKTAEFLGDVNIKYYWFVNSQILTKTFMFSAPNV